MRVLGNFDLQSKDSPFNKVLTTGESYMETYTNNSYLSIGASSFNLASKYQLIDNSTIIHVDIEVKQTESFYVVTTRGSGNGGWGIQVLPSNNQVLLACFDKKIHTFTSPTALGERCSFTFVVGTNFSVTAYKNGSLIGTSSGLGYASANNTTFRLGAAATSTGAYSNSFNSKVYKVSIKQGGVEEVLLVGGEDVVNKEQMTIHGSPSIKKQKLLLSQPKTPYALQVAGNSSSALPVNFSGDFTIAMTVMPHIIDRYYNTLFSRTVNTLDGRHTIELTFGGDSQNDKNRINFSLNLYTNIGGRVSTTTPIQVGKYYSIIITKIAAITYLYVDGILIGSVDISAAPSSPNYPSALNGTAEFPGSSSTGIRYFQTFSMWNRGFTLDELNVPMFNDLDKYRNNVLFAYDCRTNVAGILKAIIGTDIPRNTNSLYPDRVESTAPIGQRSSLKFYQNATNCGNPTVFQNLSTFSVDLWFNPATTGSALGTGYLVTKENPDLGAGDGSGWGLYYSSGRIGFFTRKAVLSGGNTNTYVSSHNLALYKHQHIVFTFDNGTAVIYVDNQEVYRVTGVPLIIDNVTPLMIGGKPDNTSTSHGIISNVRLWSNILTLVDIPKIAHIHSHKDTPNLIEQWNITEGIGRIIYGTKGINGNIAVNNTLAWQTPTVANWVNKCAITNGSETNYIKASASLKDVLTNHTVTIECWVKPKSYTGDGSSVQDRVYLYQPNNRTSSVSGFALWFQGDTGKFYVNTTTLLGTTRSLVSSTVITLSAWYHVAFVIQPLRVELYINGVLEAFSNQSTPHAIDIHPTEHLRLGRQNVSFIGGTTGLYKSNAHVELDEIRIWNSARSSIEIQENRTRVLDRHSNLVGYWRMDGNGWDASGHGNHLVPVGYAQESDAFVVSDNPNLIYNAPIND